MQKVDLEKTDHLELQLLMERAARLQLEAQIVQEKLNELREALNEKTERLVEDLKPCELCEGVTVDVNEGYVLYKKHEQPEPKELPMAEEV